MLWIWLYVFALILIGILVAAGLVVFVIGWVVVAFVRAVAQALSDARELDRARRG